MSRRRCGRRPACALGVRTPARSFALRSNVTSRWRWDCTRGWAVPRGLSGPRHGDSVTVSGAFPEVAPAVQVAVKVTMPPFFLGSVSVEVYVEL